MALNQIDVNSKDKKTGNTAFMEALTNFEHQKNDPNNKEKALSILKLLNNRGSIDLESKNVSGLSALDLAKEYKMPTLQEGIKMALNCKQASTRANNNTKNLEPKNQS